MKKKIEPSRTFVDISEQQSRLMFNTMLQGVVFQDKNGKIIGMNPSAERILGKSPEDFLGESSMSVENDCIRADGTPFPGVEHPAMVSLKTGREVRDIVMGVYNPHERAYRWINITAIPIIKAGSDKPHEVYTIFNDITESKEAERELKWNREKDELLAGISSKLLSEEKPQTIIDELAERTMKFLNCDVFFNYLVEMDDEGITLNAYEGVPEPDVDGMRHLALGEAVCGRVAKGGKRIIVEDILGCEDERTPFLRSQGVDAYACHPLLAEGKVIGTLSFGTKTRKRFAHDELSVMQEVANLISMALYRLIKNMELEESEKRYRHLVQYAPTGIYEIDFREPRFKNANEAMSELSGYSKEELLSMDPFDLLDAESKDRFRARINELYAGNTADDMVEYGVVKKDGSHVDVVLNIKIISESGRSPRALIVGHDITERKKAEEELRVSKKQLQAINEELNRSNMELQQFAYVTSHDLREPLRMVASFLELLDRKYRGKILDDKAGEYVDYAVNGAVRMQQMIDDILAYSRVETTGRPLALVDMNSVISIVKDDLKAEIESTGSLIIHAELPNIKADQLQMVLLLENLIGNSMKFNDKAVPEIKVRAERMEGEWVFAVEDNGIGFSPEYSDKIFLMFERLHSKEQYPGTGIGLAICKKIVERHGGKIWAESEEGKGATFYFSIPIKEG